jgi:dipeptidase E
MRISFIFSSLALLASFPAVTLAQTIFVGGRGYMVALKQSVLEVIALTGKTNPTVLYLGTPAYDSPDAAEVYTPPYREQGCTVEFLNVSWPDVTPSYQIMSEMFTRADIVLISGGTTLYAVDRWKKLGIDKLMKSATMERNTVLVGGSAGFISLCDGAHASSMEPQDFKNPVGPLLNPDSDVRDEVNSNWQYIRVPGISVIDGLCCPHYDTNDNSDVFRSDDFDNMMRRHSGENGIAIDGWAALVIERGETFRVLTGEDASDCPIASGCDGGSVGHNATFAFNSTGKPGAYGRFRSLKVVKY